ncbi:division/cell wall cluster transcriptional repressor MraZ [Fulvivirgaceae bacterium BMA10]|uniref:Transcriptional regulator MraZ n=1 Tax=Splendidivirga corallicola TaxID=3051826 RepID=A0ABT8KP01_9BACT|nr:division/cell wall cluster transcriptional repressor MraZ [Fulvivirgaceae bacterium BMA10]
MTSLFSGEFLCKLDAKGRLMLPARLKNKLPKEHTRTLMLQKSFDQCITIYPLVEFEKMIKRYENLDELDPEVREFERNFMRGIDEVEMDNNFRFLIPKKFQQALNLQKEVLVIGVRQRMEIWNPETFESKYEVKDEQQFKDLSKRILEKKNQEKKG